MTNIISCCPSLVNNMTRVWISDKDGKLYFESMVNAFRMSVEWNDDGSSGLAKLMLWTRIPAYKGDYHIDLVNGVPSGATIEVHGGDCGNPAAYKAESRLITMEDCFMIRGWLSNLSALTGQSEDHVKQWVVFGSYHWDILRPKLHEIKDSLWRKTT